MAAAASSSCRRLVISSVYIVKPWCKTLAQEAELQKEQQEAQREAQEWSARAQCAAIEALSPEQAAAGDGHWDKCFAYVERMVAAVPEEQRKVAYLVI